MQKPRVLLDVDGVLANFLTPALDILNKLSGLDHKAEELQEWDVFTLYPREYEQAFYEGCNQPGFCNALPLYPGAHELVTGLQAISDLYIVTSPMHHNLTWTGERERWLLKHFSIPSSKIVHTSAKYLCVGDVLIDDRPANIEAWEKEHGPKGVGLLWDASYNAVSSVGTRVRGVAEALSFVQNIRVGLV